MSHEEHTQVAQEQPDGKQKKPAHRPPPLLSYLIVLFSIAFLLLFLSYSMQQRQSDQEVIIEGMQQNTSAMQSVHTLIEQNSELRNQLSQTEEELSALEAQTEQKLEEEHNQTLALDWLWRIEREFLQRRYSTARALIKEFEATGLKASLPDTALVDPDYRTPLEQYTSMYDQLF